MPLPPVSRISAASLSFRPGERLREARETSGLMAEDVARAIGISLAQLGALETDNYDDLPEPVFIRGYMKRYAECVGLAPQEIAERFDDAYQSVTGRSPHAASHPNPVRVIGELNGVSRRHRREAVMIWLRRAFRLAVLLVVAAVVITIARKPLHLSLPAPGAATVPTETVLPAGTLSAPSATDRLTLHLMADTTVNILDADGRELSAGVHKAGEDMQLSGVAPFRIELNPASAVRLQFNDQPIDLGPYTVNDNVNFRLSR
ncbi:MAG TPA: RodZ domain-containing protein [Fluviicoccus sp.]|nr:RodZ domain-containing protein [Fluviicoccus sp.]